MFYIIKIILVIGLILSLIDFTTRWTSRVCDVHQRDLVNNDCYFRYLLLIVVTVLVIVS